MGIAEDIIVIVIAGLIAGLICHKLKFPLFIGYIAVGVIVGPYTGGFTVASQHDLNLLSEIGVALLLFSIGLELSLDELKEVKLIALVGAPLQILLTIMFGYTVGLMFDYNSAESLVIGAVASLSSTMIVLKILEARQLIGTLSSKVMIGILIVQDLAAVPMMIILSVTDKVVQTGNYYLLVIPIIKASVFTLLIILLGNKLIPLIFKRIASLNSHELFLLTVTAIGLGVGLLTYLAGLSFAFGAFVAGLVLSRSDFNHKALNDIIPLRDIFALIFFVCIGMLFDPSYFLKNITLIIYLVVLVVAGKFIILALLSRLFGYYNIVPLAVGFGLSQIGEFSFIIATLAMDKHIIGNELFSVMVSTTIITMFLSPFIFSLATPAYKIFKNKFRKEFVKVDNIKSALNGHIIIAGGGRVGLNVAHTLSNLGFSFVVIEQNHKTFETVKSRSYPVVYGDASNYAVIKAVKAKQARLLLITVPSIKTARELITLVRDENPKITIIARADGFDQMKELAGMNIYELVQPEFEASLEIIRQSMLFLDMPPHVIQQYTDDIRHQKYAPLYKEDGMIKTPHSFKNVSMLIQLFWIELPPGSHAIGKSIRELNIRKKTGALVVGISRNNEFHANPSPDFVFSDNDMVAIIGSAKAREQCLLSLI